MRAKFKNKIEYIEKYLVENSKLMKNNFTILIWWKVNALRVSIIFQMVQNILTVLIYTIASKSIFDTKGHFFISLGALYFHKLCKLLYVLKIEWELNGYIVCVRRILMMYKFDECNNLIHQWVFYCSSLFPLRFVKGYKRSNPLIGFDTSIDSSELKRHHFFSTM